MSKFKKLVNNPELFVSDMIKKRKQQLLGFSQPTDQQDRYKDMSHMITPHRHFQQGQPELPQVTLGETSFQISQILLMSDILMTKEKEQFSNLKWFSDLLAFPLAHAAKIPAKRISSSLSQANKFNRVEFFKRSNIQLDVNQTQFFYDHQKISAASLEYLKGFISPNSLVIAYELSEQTRRIFNSIGVVYIDIWLHPIRFLDDILFGFSSNHPEVFQALKAFMVQPNLYQLYANRLKIQLYKGYKRPELQLEKNAALFVGQTLEDKAICRQGKMLTLLDFKERFDQILKTHSKVYYSRHPYVKKGDEDILSYLKTKPNVEVVSHSAYDMIAHENIKYVFSVSSSVVFEARAFGKKADFLYRPVFEISDVHSLRSYISVYQDFVSPHFWAQVLQPIVSVNPDAEKLQFLDQKDKLRDMLAFYWSYKNIDKLEGMRQQLNALDRVVQTIKTQATPITQAVRAVVNHPVQAVQPKFSKIIQDRMPKALSNSKMIGQWLGLIDRLEDRLTVHHVVMPAPVVQLPRIEWVDQERQRSMIEANIKAATVVSFDVFDTLLVRPFGKPDDLFIAMQPFVDQLTDQLKDFRKIRLEARKQVPEHAHVGEEIPLYARYQAIQAQYQLSDEVTEKLYQLELQLEYASITPRGYAKQLFEFALAQGKQVIIVSDTFFDREFMVSLLQKNGFTDYHRLFISSESGVLKATGHFYPYVLEQMGVEAQKILHIGDNAAVDIQQAEKHAFKTLHLPSVLDVFAKRSKLAALYQPQKSLYAKVLTGVLAAHYADEPNIYPTPSYTGGRVERFGYSIFGPMLFGFVCWLKSQAKQQNIKQLLFLARDGWIMKQAYDLIRTADDPEGVYIYASRRSYNVAGLFTLDDINGLLAVNFSPMPLHELLMKRFGIAIEAEHMGLLTSCGFDSAQTVVRYHEDKQRLKLLCDHLQSDILANAQIERERLMRYFAQQGIDIHEPKTAVVDIGHNGTMQLSLSKLLNHQSLHGYYFATHQGIEKLTQLGFSAQGYAIEKADPKDKTHPCMQYILMFELLFLNEQSSFMRFDDDLNPVFVTDKLDATRAEMIRSIHQGALQFVTTIQPIVKLLHIDDTTIIGHKPLTLDAYARFLAQPQYVDVKMFEGVYFENLYSGRDFKLIVSATAPDQSVWIEGAQLLQAYATT